MRAVLFDVDGTLLDKPGTEARFVFYLLRRRVLGWRQLRSALVFFLRWGWRYHGDTARKNKAYLDGLEIAMIGSLAAEFVVREVVPRLRPALVQRLHRHREGGEQVALLTGTPDFIAAPLAGALGIEHYCATRCRDDGHRFLPAPPLRHPLGTSKFTHARRLCAVLGVRLQDCIAYADTARDLPLLSRVRQPVAVTPDRTLRHIARERDWEILDTPASERELAAQVHHIAPAHGIHRLFNHRR
jgi:HAD superfamily hydrolase (TIGR01490 family)